MPNTNSYDKELETNIKLSPESIQKIKELCINVLKRKQFPEYTSAVQGPDFMKKKEEYLKKFSLEELIDEANKFFTEYTKERVKILRYLNDKNIEKKKENERLKKKLEDIIAIIRK